MNRILAAIVMVGPIGALAAASFYVTAKNDSTFKAAGIDLANKRPL
jgi:hypothetical protein